LQERIIIGHKGAAGLAPENTLLSYTTAFELGIPMIELDIHETLDGHLVCIHDESVDRTTNGVGIVCEMTLNQLKRLDAGKGERIPLLSEVLDFARNKLRINIEIKTLGVESRLVDLVASRNMIGDVLVSSFFHGTLLAIKELNPIIKTAALINTIKPNLIPYVLELGADAVNPRFTSIRSEFVEDAHQNRLNVYAWTVNDAITMSELFRIGVDGIITDYPDIGLDVVRRFIN
jgi:glycerophosphoryl diester phosphodiesterase